MYALIDGFNLYHAIDDLVHNHLKWVNPVSLAGAFVVGGEDLRSVHYFTAVPSWNVDKRHRHEALLDVYRDLGINITPGEFRFGKGKCLADCRLDFVRWEEKETDINIAIALLRIARDRLCDKVLLITGDSDQVASIRFAKEMWPDLKVKVVFPPGRHSKELVQTADEHAKMNRDHIERHRLADPYVKRAAAGGTIPCPTKWRLGNSCPSSIASF